MTTELVTDKYGKKRKVPKEFKVKLEGYLDCLQLVYLKQELVTRYARDISYEEALQGLVIKALRDKEFW